LGEKERIARLVEGCLKNQKIAQKALYDQYSKAMFNVAVRILGTVPEAEDALQESFIKMFNSLPKFDGRVTFGAWFKRITINECLNRLRKNKLNWMEVDQEIPEEQPEEKEVLFTSEKLNQAIAKLPDGCRAVFTLKAFEEYKHNEIADSLGISLSTSKSQFIRAKKLLQQTLSP
jgi:RNA polymerase sigma-70 factor (ECF subfamily)